MYCPRCGRQNPDDAKFCSGCGGSLVGPSRPVDKEWEDKCEKECAGGPRGGSIIWAVIIIVVGLAIALSGLQSAGWLPGINLGFVFPLLIGLIIIIVGLSMLSKRR